MTKEELNFFHENLRYMWDKLGISHYYAKRLDKMSRNEQRASKKNLQGEEFLPSYATLSKCMNHRSFEPPMSAVYGIVDYYNCNLQPPVDAFRFLHERLADSDIWKRTSETAGDRFLGTYYLTYPSLADTNCLSGGVLKIYKEADIRHNTSRYLAAFITGIRNDEALVSGELLDVFSEKPSLKKFETYYDRQKKYNQRCSYYEGDAEITLYSMTISAKELNGEHKRMTLSFNLRGFPVQTDKKDTCDSLLGFAIVSSDGSYNTTFYKLGLIHVSNGCISLMNQHAKEVLDLDTKRKNRVTLTDLEDREWYKLMLREIEEGGLMHAPGAADGRAKSTAAAQESY